MSGWTNNNELHEQTQVNMNRIDQQLDAIVDLTATQKVLAKSIGNELEDQSKMLDTSNRHMDMAQMQVDKANTRLTELKKKAGTWSAWLLIVLLIVAIILVWVLIK